MPEIIVFIIGLAAAIRGADWVGSAAVKWAKQQGVSQIVVGATLVSFATTLPEISIATIGGLINKDPLVALGAVLGSPLVNLGVILGILFIFSRRRPSTGYYLRALNIFLVTCLVLLILSFYRPLGNTVSLLFIALGIMFLVLEFIIGKRSIGSAETALNRFEGLLSLFSFPRDRALLLEFVLGVILLGVGSKFMVDSTISIASLLKIDEFFISVTLVAIGTSLPEFITAVNSLIYKRESLSVGNLVGASVIDITLGTGLATLFKGATLSYPINLYIFIPMIIIGILCLAALWKKLPLALVGVSLVVTAAASLALFSLQTVF